jgi:hypothetical protein
MSAELKFQVGDLIRFVDDERTGPRQLRGELAVVVNIDVHAHGPLIYELLCLSHRPSVIVSGSPLWTSDGSSIEKIA